MPHLLISGGTRGIGRACVELFAGKGYKVTSLARTGKPKDAVEGVLYLQCDVKDPESVKDSVIKALEENGDIDVLISNAGINIPNMTNKSRGEVAYTIIDCDTMPDESVFEKLRQIDGVARVRVIRYDHAQAAVYGE